MTAFQHITDIPLSVTRNGAKGSTTTGMISYFKPTKWLTFAIGIKHTSGHCPKAKATAVMNVLRGSPDMLEGPRVEESSPAGSYQLPICCLCAGV